ncbi:hypothetical protein PC128_g2778 [Phytophthora cactorum]|nr:hypothetical protein PC128_g2778 [Phytophthora cactorum]
MEDRTQGWSLTNYLRSDPHYYRWVFEKSLSAAAERGNCAIVKWLFANFSDCEAPKEVVRAAERQGHLHVLRFLLEHRSDNGRASRSCQTEGTTVSAESDDAVPRKCTVQFDEGYDGHYWGHTVIHKAIENGQLVQCLEEGILLDPYDREIAIKHALQLGDMDFAERLLPPGQSIDQYAADVARPEMIQMMLDSGNLQWDEQRAATALGHLGAHGDLELMQQIFQLHSPLREDHGYWKEAWSEALRGACSDGDLSVLQWLIEHPLRSEQWAERQTWCKQMLFENAAKNGHVRVMQYLHDQGLVIDTINRSSFGELQLDSVKWLIENDMIGDQHDFSYAIAQAALHGRLDILQLFQALDTPWSNEAVGFKRRRTGQAFSLWGGDRDTFYWAAQGGHVHVLEWLQENYSAKCGTDAMNTAAYLGRLEAVKWLHANRTEGVRPMQCTTPLVWGDSRWLNGCI